MRIGFVVNNVQTEKAQFTTTRLAMTAVHQGHGRGNWESATSSTRRTDRSEPSPAA